MWLNCRGCGIEVDPSQADVDRTVDEVLQSSIDDAIKTGGVCPLCGHSKATPYAHRKPVLFILLIIAAGLAAALLVARFLSARTERVTVADEAVRRATRSALATSILGTPIVRAGEVSGYVKHDETGWTETDLTIGIRGPNGAAQMHVMGGRGAQEWTFTTADIMAPAQKKKIDLISGRVVPLTEAHTQPAIAAVASQQLPANFPTPAWDGSFPCVLASGRQGPSVVRCKTLLPGDSDPGERFEVDLRYGKFILRETDLAINDVVPVPLERTFSTGDWISSNAMHAFGMHSNQVFDIAPLGTRNPYTEVEVVLSDGNFLHYSRISKGTGYADAVYAHAETSSSFFRSTIGWNGAGWTLTKADGSIIHFPESYSAKTLAQGAATDMIDPLGNTIELRRDTRRNLTEIHTPHGRYIRLKYDDGDRIVHAEDDRGEWANYKYAANGYLTDVALSNGRERHFSYDDGQMVLIRDEQGRALVRNRYSYGVVVGQEFSNGQSVSYNYHRNGNTYYWNSVDVTLPTGTVTVNPVDSVPARVKQGR